jgi:hypothetical protein
MRVNVLEVRVRWVRVNVLEFRVKFRVRIFL